MPDWKPVYETSAFEPDSFSEILWYFTRYLGFRENPKYVVSSAPLNNYTTEFSAAITLAPRTPRDEPLTYYGRGSTGLMAIREASYLAITELHTHFAIGGDLFRYYPYRVGADHENNFLVPEVDESPMVRHLTRLVRAMDDYIGRMDRERAALRTNVARLQNAVDGQFRVRQVPHMVMFGDIDHQAENESYPSPGTYLGRVCRQARMSTRPPRNQVLATRFPNSSVVTSLCRGYTPSSSGSGID